MYDVQKGEPVAVVAELFYRPDEGPVRVGLLLGANNELYGFNPGSAHHVRPFSQKVQKEVTMRGNLRSADVLYASQVTYLDKEARERAEQMMTLAQVGDLEPELEETNRKGRKIVRYKGYAGGKTIEKIASNT